MTGKLVVFEGIDGSGKSSIMKAFTLKLMENGKWVFPTIEPWDVGLMGAFIRQVLRKERACSPWTLAMMFAINREDHVDLMRSVIDRGDIVVSDRYMLSSLVYQTGDGISEADIRSLNRGAISPDVTFFLDASPEVCAERLKQRGGDRQLFEDDLSRYRQKYIDAIKCMTLNDGVFVHIDADGSLEQVLARVMEAWKHFDKS